MKKVTLLAGLLLMLSAASMRAQTHEITSYLPDDKEDYRGYCIEQAEFNKGKGFLVAGSRTESGKHNSVHIMSIIRGDATSAHGQVLYLPKYDDVRAIAITMVKPDVAALLLQTTLNREVHPTLILLDCSDFNNLTVTKSLELKRGEYKFPTSICVSPDASRLYIAGYSLDNRTPVFETPKRGFVSAIDVSTLSITATLTYNTAKAINNSNDYDMIQRIRFIKDHLYVIGSANDNNTTYGASRAWVASIDPTDLHVTQQSMFGNDAFSSTGYHGVDLVPDIKVPGYFYMVSNDYYWHTWCLSRLQPNLEIMPGGGSVMNTVTYAYSSDIKGSGVLAQEDGRISVYGCMRSSFPPIPTGLNVASFNAGAVPFVATFDPKNSTNGLSAANLTWYNEGNLPGTTTNLNGRYSPYWVDSTLSYWSIPAFALLSDPHQKNSDLAMMGHVGYTGTHLAPRLIESDAIGYVDRCEGSVDVTKDVAPGVVSIILINSKNKVAEEKNELQFEGVELNNKELTHKTLTCTNDYYYLQGQTTGIATTGEAKVVLQRLSPNPATNRVTLQWKGNIGAGDVLSLELTDISGRQVGHGLIQTRTAASSTFGLPELAPGMYIASLYVNGRAAGQQKLSIK